MVTIELSKLTPKELKAVQSVIRLFHILGLTNDQIEKLPEVLSNWPTVVTNMNAMAQDLFILKQQVERLAPEKNSAKDISADTDINIRNSIGFDKNTELTQFGGGIK